MLTGPPEALMWVLSRYSHLQVLAEIYRLGWCMPLTSLFSLPKYSQVVMQQNPQNDSLACKPCRDLYFFCCCCHSRLQTPELNSQNLEMTQVNSKPKPVLSLVSFFFFNTWKTSGEMMFARFFSFVFGSDLYVFQNPWKRTELRLEWRNVVTISKSREKGKQLRKYYMQLAFYKYTLKKTTQGKYSNENLMSKWL